MDADKEGFLRDIRSLIQTIGRAARNDRGKVLMYADTITGSMQRAIDETNRRRGIQMAYNEDHGIIPQTVRKSREAILEQTGIADVMGKKTPTTRRAYVEPEQVSLAADPVTAYMDADALQARMTQVQKEMEQAARELDFVVAAKLRDELFALKKKLETAG